MQTREIASEMHEHEPITYAPSLVTQSEGEPTRDVRRHEPRAEPTRTHGRLDLAADVSLYTSN